MVNWLLVAAFAMGIMIGAILMALVAAIYVSAEDERRERAAAQARRDASG